MTTMIPVALDRDSALSTFVRSQISNPMPLCAQAADLFDRKVFGGLVIGARSSSLITTSDPRWSLQTCDPTAAIDPNEAAEYLLNFLLGLPGISKVVVELPWNFVTDVHDGLVAIGCDTGPGVAVVVSPEQPSLVKTAIKEAQGYPGGIVFALSVSKLENDAILAVALPAFDHESFIVLRPSEAG